MLYNGRLSCTESEKNFNMSNSIWRNPFLGLGFLASVAITLFVVGALGYVYLQSELPDVTQLKDIQLQEPLQIYSSDGQLIGDYGPVHRIPVTIDQIPQQLINAVLATEDSRYYEHGGIDIIGLMRATAELLMTGQKSQGGSTITMQVARNFYLTRKKTFTRKLNEIMLAMKIDNDLSKQKILELYLNKVYFGERAYGVGAAAQVYYGKTLNQLTLGEMAVLAGLPQAPSSINPIINPDAAKKRRDHVLSRMLQLGFINKDQYAAALAEPIDARYHGSQVSIHAPYVGEMVRDLMVASFGEDAYTHGYKVYTTIDSQLQMAADTASRSALLSYDKRHGYRGPMANWGPAPSDAVGLEKWQTQLRTITRVNGMRAAAVISVNSVGATALISNGKIINLPWDALAWARPKINDDTWGKQPKKPSDILKSGDVIWVQNNSDGTWWLSQVPRAQCALVSLNPQNGQISSLVGGYDYRLSSFNRVVQAQRQPGSSFKPFIYAAAFDKGFTLASVINDAPLVLWDPGAGKLWRPQNDTHKFYGPTTLRVALTQSRNLVSIRLLQALGVPYAIKYAERFGFTNDQLPHNLTLALGTADVTPLQMVSAYAAFANGGYRVTPYIIDRVEDAQGNVVYQAKPKMACANCTADSTADAVADDGSVMDTQVLSPSFNNNTSAQQAPEIISPQIAFLINSGLQSVIQNAAGTAHSATILNRTDIAGKTGTTSDFRDTWFDGYNSDIVATAWIGFDQPESTHEFGAQAALPMWIQFMRVALAGKPEHSLPMPTGIVTEKIDPATGLLAADGQTNAIDEYFLSDNVPRQTAPVNSDNNQENNNQEQASDQSGQPLF